MSLLIKRFTISYRLDKVRKRNQLTQNNDNIINLPQKIQQLNKEDENNIPEDIVMNLTNLGKVLN